MSVEPYDEEAIKSNDVIIRRVNPRHHVVPNENSGKRRISSKLFKPSSEPKGGMSVDILKLIEQAGVNARDFITTPDYTGSVYFPASAARNVGLRIGYEPIENIPGLLDNPYHGEVWGAQDKPNKFSSAQVKALFEASKWFVEIPDVEIDA